MIHQFSGAAISIRPPLHRRFMFAHGVCSDRIWAGAEAASHLILRSVRDAVEHIARSPAYVVRRDHYLRRVVRAGPPEMRSAPRA